MVPNRAEIASRLSATAGSAPLAATVHGRVRSGKPTPANSRPVTLAAAAPTWDRVAPVAAAIEARVSGGRTT